MGQTKRIGRDEISLFFAHLEVDDPSIVIPCNLFQMDFRGFLCFHAFIIKKFFRTLTRRNQGLKAKKSPFPTTSIQAVEDDPFCPPQIRKDDNRVDSIVVFYKGGELFRAFGTAVSA